MAECIACLYKRVEGMDKVTQDPRAADQRDISGGASCIADQNGVSFGTPGMYWHYKVIKAIPRN